jgi:hypothetical protein
VQDDTAPPPALHPRRKPAAPDPVAFAIHIDPTTAVEDAGVIACVMYPTFVVLVISAQVPPPGAPATVATVAFDRLHGLTADVPVLIDDLNA